MYEPLFPRVNCNFQCIIFVMILYTVIFCIEMVLLELCSRLNLDVPFGATVDAEISHSQLFAWQDSDGGEGTH